MGILSPHELSIQPVILKTLMILLVLSFILLTTCGAGEHGELQDHGERADGTGAAAAHPGDECGSQVW